MRGTLLSELSENERIKQAYQEAAESVLELIVSCCSPAEDDGSYSSSIKLEHDASCNQESQLHKHSVVTF